jgi:hypothetical protein
MCRCAGSIIKLIGLRVIGHQQIGPAIVIVVEQANPGTSSVGTAVGGDIPRSVAGIANNQQVSRGTLPGAEKPCHQAAKHIAGHQ